MSKSKYKVNDLVVVRWAHNGSGTGRRLTPAAVKALNEGGLPFESRSIERPKGKVHYYPDCGVSDYNFGENGHDVLARTIEDTDCLHCLYKRALTLRGWRWTEKCNEQEVMYLCAQLGDRVQNMGERPAQDKREDYGLAEAPAA